MYTAAENRTGRSDEERVLQGLYNDFHRSADEWISALKNDTLGLEEDSLNAAYSRHPARFAPFTLAGRFLVAHDEGRFEAQMDRITADSFLNPVSQPEKERYTELWDLLKTTDLSRRFWRDTLGAATHLALEDIAGYGEAYSASQKAMALLRSFTVNGTATDQPLPVFQCLPDPTHKSAPALLRAGG